MWRTDERGSIPLALLVVIIVGAVTAVLTSTVITGQRSTRFDAAFTDAVQYADAGVQDAVVKLNNNSLAAGSYTLDVDSTPADPVVQTTQITPQRWEVSGTATVNGTTRRVVAEIREVPLFGFALFARNGVAFNGANATDSYSSASGGTWCTGNGVVGTDGALEFSGLKNSPCHPTNKITVDGAVLYGCGALDAAACRATTYDGAPRCTHSGGDNCLTTDENLSGVPEPDNDGRLTAQADPFKLTPEEELQRVIDEDAVCEAAGWPDAPPAGVANAQPRDWVTDDGDVLTPRAAATGRDFYCVESLTFKGDTSVNRGPSGEPVRIHVRDTITVEGSGTTVNCNSCNSNNPYNQRPDSAALQVIGRNTQSFNLDDPQIMWAAAVYAPSAQCEGPAGVDIYGSLICELVDNVGAWNFHYDDALQEVGGSGRYAIATYREEMAP